MLASQRERPSLHGLDCACSTSMGAARACRKTSRGDWAPLELLIASVRGWEARLRRLTGDRKLDKS
jgi:hypothetical protein